jgi:hypothetical protein
MLLPAQHDTAQHAARSVRPSLAACVPPTRPSAQFSSSTRGCSLPPRPPPLPPRSLPPVVISPRSRSSCLGVAQTSRPSMQPCKRATWPETSGWVQHCSAHTCACPDAYLVHACVPGLLRSGQHTRTRTHAHTSSNRSPIFLSQKAHSLTSCGMHTRTCTARGHKRPQVRRSAVRTRPRHPGGDLPCVQEGQLHMFLPPREAIFFGKVRNRRFFTGGGRKSDFRPHAPKRRPFDPGPAPCPSPPLVTSKSTPYKMGRGGGGGGGGGGFLKIER